MLAIPSVTVWVRSGSDDFLLELIGESYELRGLVVGVDAEGDINRFVALCSGS